MVIKERDMRINLLPQNTPIAPSHTSQTKRREQTQTLLAPENPLRLVKHKPLKTNLSLGLQIELHKAEIKVPEVVLKLQAGTE